MSGECSLCDSGDAVVMDHNVIIILIYIVNYLEIIVYNYNWFQVKAVMKLLL